MKKSVILADNSYTIRRIVELSFSEEQDIDLISFDTGLGLKEKLIEIKPAVVLADIKLPEVDGYEICQYINSTPELKDTKVLLIKGGFEPVDENLLKDLQYVDFITKPFDSKALVTKIKDIISGEQAESQATQEAPVPSSLPEDIPTIDGIEDAKENINLSDIGDNLDTEKFFGDGQPPDSEGSIGDDVLPSEEITQGSGAEESEDHLSPEVHEDIDNPFMNDSSLPENGHELSEEEKKIKENIKQQEEELNISSLTMEEINIQKEIEKQNLSEPVEKKDETSDIEENKIENVTAPPSVGQIDDSKIENVFSPDLGKEFQEDIPPMPQREETKKTIPDVTEPASSQEELEKVLSDMKSQETLKPETPEPEEKPSEPAAEVPPVSPAPDTPGTADKEQIMKNVEDKLSLSVKEVLWEIVPPLAEKLIKEEINKIEQNLEKEFSPDKKTE